MGKKSKSRPSAKSAEPPQRESKDTPPAPPRTRFDVVRENAEALVLAIILALLIRHFAVEAYEIPTGSMAPSLYGIHGQVNCPNCDTAIDIALKADDSGQANYRYQRDPTAGTNEPVLVLHKTGMRPRARCHLCQYRFSATLTNDNVIGGDKILVTKFSYTLGKPHRWDVIVFGFDQWKNYIKRLIGLPGERIDLWNGDVYVNGKIERKPRHAYIQDALWVKVADSDVAEKGLHTVPAWAATDGMLMGKVVNWDAPNKRWTINGGSETVTLDYHRRVDNYYSYNLLSGELDSRYEVGDRKLALTVRAMNRPAGVPAGESWVGAELREGAFTWQLRIPIGSPSAEHPAVLQQMTNHLRREKVDPLRAPLKGGLRKTAAVSITPGRDVRIEFENVDDIVAVRMDGKVVMEIEYTSFPEIPSDSTLPPSLHRQEHYLRLITHKVQVGLESIQVFRDMYYIGRESMLSGGWPRLNHSFTLKEDEYLALGDNGPSSSDGRYWGTVPEKNLMGKGLSVFWPVWPSVRWKFIR